MKKIFIAGLLSILAAQVFADPKSYYYERAQSKQLQSKKNIAAPDSVREATFLQLIDHNNPTVGTFRQRYYIDESYGFYNNSPVFFYLCGEAACDENQLNGAIRDIAKKFNAKLVALEHRYYGKSMPLPSLSTQNLRYLTTELALKDIKRFQENITHTKNWTGKWVVFGGSYPGSLSAYYRLKYPEMVSGALASSAPVMAQENFEAFDAHVAKMVGSACLAKIKSTVSYIESVLDDKFEIYRIKSMFQAEKIVDNQDFLYLVADLAATAVQYGMKDKFCQKLTYASNPLNGYADFANYFYKAWDVNALTFNTQGAMDEDPRHYESFVGMRAWYYQSCTEYGYWQNAHSDASKSSRSPLINLDYHKNVCRRLFNIKYDLDTSYINNEYYYPLLYSNVTNIYFTNGSTDPWSNLSISKILGNNINPNLDYDLIEGAAHCDDLKAAQSTDSFALTNSRTKLEGLIRKWLW